MNDPAETVRQLFDQRLQELHQRCHDMQKNDDEFTTIEYAEMNNIPIGKAALEIDKLLKMDVIVFSRKCIFRNKERNAYKFK